MTQEQYIKPSPSSSSPSALTPEHDAYIVPDSLPTYQPFLAPIIQEKNTLPAFLNKLYGMVNAPETDPWVHWAEDGESFIIPNNTALEEQVLGHHFKHNNFASFVRQLNMYGFHKVPHLNHGVLHNNGVPEVWEFNNPNFLRDDPASMKFIVRKKGEAEKARSAAKQHPSSSAPNPQPSLTDPNDIAILRAELQSVATRQNIIRDELMRLAASNSELWKFAVETRDRHQEQQNTLNSVIKVMSEAFRGKRFSPTNELPNKVRGLLEAPSAFEELSDTTPVHTPAPEQGQLDVMKMIANGKMPLGFQEAIQHYLQNIGQGNILPQTPVSPNSPTTLESSDALTMYQAAQNNQHLAQVQDWVNRTDQSINGLGFDFNQTNHVNYGEYLDDPNFNFDSFVTQAHPETNVDMFGADPSLDASLLHPWIPNYLDSEIAQDINVHGQKRALEDDEEGETVAKKART
jgi:heat shock transcription factor